MMEELELQARVFLLIFSLSLFWPHWEACVVLVPQPEIEPEHLHWKYSILTSGPPGKSSKLELIDHSVSNENK